MLVLRCTACGGQLEINGKATVCVCEYCGSTVLIPKNLDRNGNLYNRAVFLRQNNEFDSAVSVYEDLLKEDNTDAEAHWGLVLSKFGIEYVVDPKTNERIPTCHRMQTRSILSDPDYKAALEYSDPESRAVIEKEAKRISQIQAGFLAVCRNEPPYDVFICYKETDDAGNRTEDSILAQDLYFELNKKGYKTFFARKTLENKLGKEYEPIIFAALSSAKVMVVLGTKPEYFNAVWVRNEWSRFLKMSDGTNKTLIPAYRGMSPYELPDSLSSLQSLDMSKIGFFQDLTDAIEKLLKKKDKQPSAVPGESVSAIPASYGIMPLDRYLKNADTFLRLKNYDEAFSTYLKVTETYPDDYRGWLGLIAAKTKNFTDFRVNDSILNLSKWLDYTEQLIPASESDKIPVEITELRPLIYVQTNIHMAFVNPAEFNADIFSKAISLGGPGIVDEIDSGILSAISEQPAIPSSISVDSYQKTIDGWKQFIEANKLLIPCISAHHYNLKRSSVSKMIAFINSILNFYMSAFLKGIPSSVRNHSISFQNDRNYFRKELGFFSVQIRSMPANGDKKSINAKNSYKSENDKSLDYIFKGIAVIFVLLICFFIGFYLVIILFS